MSFNSGFERDMKALKKFFFQKRGFRDENISSFAYSNQSDILFSSPLVFIERRSFRNPCATKQSFVELRISRPFKKLTTNKLD